jgi:hypothetical protein
MRFLSCRFLWDVNAREELFNLKNNVFEERKEFYLGAVMSRVKWDLDQLKEVQKQQEVAMTATEQVINDARNDLNSMTEDVWEVQEKEL